jgi:SAM-dependent methyltransferase
LLPVIETLMQKEPWYESWFDTPFYHLLYSHRNELEARQHIDQLFQFLQPAEGSKILDLACGKGRHSKYISEKGFDVTGFDLSPYNIQSAKELCGDHLHFEVRDMRHFLGLNDFDVVLNLFTSFGYFDSMEEHLVCFRRVHDALKDNGLFVLDYLNAQKIIDGLVPEEVVIRGGIEFHITRQVEKSDIVKVIHFEADGRKYSFQERVKAFTASDFEDFCHKSEFRIRDILGTFEGTAFDPATSPRFILIAEKQS